MDHARKELAETWLRHPVLGDPSFDSFVHRPQPVLVSREPYAWTVNGSLFRDPVTGKWLLQAGHYAEGYGVGEGPSYAELLLSEDEGMTFRSLGPALAPGSPFAGVEAPTGFPDTVVEYDPATGKYYMAYDTSTPDFTWERAHDPTSTADGGGAIAVADRVEGPYTRLPGLAASRKKALGLLGRFDRLYAATLLRRAADWLMLVLCDSGPHFAWGYAALTAPSPEGPWSAPVMVLSCDTPGYYPTPVEFHPAMVREGMIYASATSVALNRNYQALFAAPLEEAHRPEAWRLARDGSLWHSEPLPQEAYGIWGQTIHGFIHNGTYQVMFPSRNAEGYGTVNLASRPWNTPLSDGFTLSGHQGPSQTFLYGSWRDFSLEVDFSMAGAVTFVLDMAGVIGPNRNISDAFSIPLNRCRGLTLDGGRWRLEAFDAAGKADLLAEGPCPAPGPLKMARRAGVLSVSLGDGPLFTLPLPGEGPLGLACGAHSRIRVTRWALSAPTGRYRFTYNGWEGLLGAGRQAAEWQIDGDTFSTEKSCAKYNVIGDTVDILGPRGPEGGVFRVVVDGETKAAVSAAAPEPQPAGILARIGGLTPGRHGVRLEPIRGTMTLTGLAVSGEPFQEEEHEKL